MRIWLLQETFGDVPDPLLRLPVYWADCEAHLAGDAAAARAVWEAVLKTAAGRSAQQQACDMEMQRGASPACDLYLELCVQQALERCVCPCRRSSEAWVAYISMERALRHIREARALYKRCYARKFADGSQPAMCHAWLRFEREEGR
jgi:squamous cell carcinoma antigen recognized by T-cells 3